MIWRIAKWAGIGLAVIVGIALAAILLVPILAPSVLKDPIEAAAGAATGREIRVAGSVRVPLAWPPRLTLRDVRMANADWASDTPMVRFERLTVRLEPSRLFEGERAIREVELAAGQVLLERDGNGRDNWTLSPEKPSPDQPERKKPEDADPIPVKRVLLRDLTLAVKTPDFERRLDFDRIALRATRLRTVQADIALAYEKLPVDLRVTAILPEPGSDRYPVQAELSAGGTSVALDVLATLAAGEGTTVEGSLRAQGEDLDAVDPIVDADLPDTAPYDVESSLRLEGDSVRFENVVFRIGGMDVRGDILFDSGDTPRLEAELAVAGITVPAPQMAAFDMDRIAIGRAEITLTAAADALEDLPFNLRADIAFSDTGLLSAEGRALGTLSSLSAAAQGRTAPVSAQVEGSYLDRPLKLSLRGGPLSSLMADKPAEPLAVRVQAIYGESTAKVDATMPPPYGLDRFNGSLAVATPDIKQATAMLDVPIADPLTLALTADIRREGPLWQASAIDVHLAQSTLAGTLTFRAAQRRFEGALQAETLRTKDLQFLESDPGIDLSKLKGLTRVEGRLALEADRLVWEGGAVRNASLTAELSAGRLKIAPLEGDMPGGGRLSAEIVLDVAKEPQQLSLKASLSESDLAPWLDGDPAWRKVLLGGAKLDLSARGRTPKELLAATEGRLELSDADLRYNVAGAPAAAEMALETAEIARQGETMSVAAQGRYQGRPLALEGAIGNIGALYKEGRSHPVSLDVTAGKTEGALEGKVDSVFTGFDIGLELAGPTLDRLYPLLGISLGPTPPYDLTMTLAYGADEGVWRARGIDGTVGDSDLSGLLTVNPRQGRPLVTADFQSKTLDLDDLAGFVGATPAAGEGETVNVKQKREAKAETGDGLIMPTETLDFTPLRTFDANIALKAEEVRVQAVPLRALDMRFRLEGGLAQLAPFDFAFQTGEVELMTRLNAREDIAALTVQGQVDKVGLDQLVRGWKIAGRLGGYIDLEGRGNSVHAIMAGIDGDLSVGLSGGAVDLQLIELVGLDLFEYLGLALSDGEETVAIRCAIVQSDAEDGTFGFDTFVFDTPDTVIVGEGALDMTRERLDLKLEPRPKDVSPLAARAPIHIEGKLIDIGIGPDTGQLVGRSLAAIGIGILIPPAALVALVETGGGENAPCGAFLAEIEENREQAAR